MSEIKTKQTDADVRDFINAFADTEQKRIDSLELLELMSDFTKFEPKMWGASIIGFGSYHYNSERSKQEGDCPIVGFSPRKSAISLYVYTRIPEHEHLLDNLGKFKMGKACIYIKKLADIDKNELKNIIQKTIEYRQRKLQEK